ncbi:4-hydroxybenzoate polyprenyltransferase [Azospirillum lipoferum]|uniref:4-hydroxybenzoate polyprenyltransferase n=1 Tax=Azospirillum lipoferum TaxID=193 RepID=A0A5A9G3I5_AZOLI|nr:MULTISPECIES: UbiA family prenyltransferase [Azospirillum]KAA0589140.1 hypothetical protein FZ942_32460 [Azospirillum lipoferum]MCP1613413.1 4-hydroxybenzoate polyprenyltransferase [Azospirillum lipoferum]MDW5533151.1 UbiA family prenyltransferase [Azospirillum sp. NL1]
MGVGTAVLIRPRAALILGRVSNLPTVLSNAMAGIALAGAGALDGMAGGELVGGVARAAIVLALFYVGGMYLNDAFDAEIDARERPARPIPRGDATRGTVFAAGFALIGLGLALAAVSGLEAGLCGGLLAGAILLYDILHKRTAAAPAIMGLCRLLSYATAAAAVGGEAGGGALAPWMLLGAGGLFCHVVGLTFAARQEAYDRLDNAWPLGVLAVPLTGALWVSLGSPLAFGLWAALAAATGWAVQRLFRRAPGDVPRAVAVLIAAIALYDAVLIAAAGSGAAAPLTLAAALCFPLTLALQRVIPGT